MASSSSSSVAVLLLLLLVATATAQECPTQLGNLNVCGPFVVPGAASPSSECCSAVKSVQHDCLCSTLQITARLPSLCGLPPLGCPAPTVTN
ncbi:Stamen-specific protein FIL1 [Linum perenne]